MDAQSGVEAVLEMLYERRGLDFRGYRRSTIERRLNHRLSALRAPDCQAYLDLLSRDPEELEQLAQCLTLKVTGFFRNPPVFALLHDTILPALLGGQDEVTIWSAGCATGEEPYSMAMLIEELLEGRARRPVVRIIGTDIDTRALEIAQQGRYAAPAVGAVAVATLERWFKTEGGRHGPSYTLREEVRAYVSFVRHNLIDGTLPPGSGAAGFDLVLCRNVLIYFERRLQERVVALLGESVRPEGYLVLGEAESLPREVEGQYRCLDRRGRVFQKKRG